jgi:hypothetical protein
MEVLIVNMDSTYKDVLDLNGLHKGDGELLTLDDLEWFRKKGDNIITFRDENHNIEVNEECNKAIEVLENKYLTSLALTMGGISDFNEEFLKGVEKVIFKNDSLGDTKQLGKFTYWKNNNSVILLSDKGKTYSNKGLKTLLDYDVIGLMKVNYSPEMISGVPVTYK